MLDIEANAERHAIDTEAMAVDTEAIALDTEASAADIEGIASNSEAIAADTKAIADDTEATGVKFGASFIMHRLFRPPTNACEKHDTRVQEAIGAFAFCVSCIEF